MSAKRSVEPPPVAPRGGRPRDERATDAILWAAVEVIAEHGVAGASVRKIAARAGVGLPTIYRRWRTQEELIVAALETTSPQLTRVSSAHIRDDLIGAVGDQVVMFQETATGRAFLSLIAAAFQDPRWLEVFRGMQVAQRTSTRDLVVEAVTRGELSGDTDPDLLLDMIAGVIYTRILFGEGLTRFDVPVIVDRVLSAFAPNGGL